MAKLTSTLFTFSGSLDGLSVFKMEGVEQPVVRRKGGAKREKILHDPCFANTRRVMGEFGGRSVASRFLLEAFAPLRPGLGTTGRINSLLTALQKMDTTSPWGIRSVALSRCPQLLQGLDISRRLTLEGVLQTALHGHITRETLSARLDLPPLLPGVNCTHPKTHPFFQVVAVLGVMPDLFYLEKLDEYQPQEGYSEGPAQVVETAWHQTNTPVPATVLEPALPQAPGVEGYSLVLSVALRYGKLGPTGVIEPLPKAVAARIVAVA